MKALGFGHWTSAGFVSNVAPDAGPDGRKMNAAYMAMSDYLLLTADIPQSGMEDIEAWVSKNLPRFFPDEPDRHPFDVLPRSRGSGRSRQVLFTSAECLAEYRNAFPGLPLASLIAAFRDVEGDSVRVLAMPCWIEWASREDGIWTLGQRIEVSTTFRTALSMLLAELAERPSALPVQLIYDPATEADVLELADAERVRAVPFEQAFDPRRAKRQSHFDREAKLSAVRVRAIAAMGAIAALFILANVLLFVSSSSNRAEREKNVSLLKGLKASETADKALLAQRDSLLAGSGNPAAFPSARSLLGALALGLGPKARLVDFSQENGSFTANLEAPNALASLSALESSDGFAELKISGIKATDKGERFCLTGRYHEAR